MDTPTPTLIYHAAAIRDAVGREARPGTVVVRGGHILAAGPTKDLRGQSFDHPIRHELPDHLILPGMVNAHCHLDLNSIDYIPYNGSFPAWIRHVQANRPEDSACVGKIVAEAAMAAYTSGVIAVGDVASGKTFTATRQALEQSPLIGVSFEELLGPTPPVLPAIEATDVPTHSRRGIRAGLQPHAPYSTSLPVYQWAADRGQQWGMPLATHLAELPEEVEFVRHGQGPFRELLVSLGRWNRSFSSHYGGGQHPVDWLQPILVQGRWLLAHCNQLHDNHLAVLVACDASVAYCPVASDYFGHRNHRYRELLTKGVNVCLGTDSIICQPAEERQPLGIMAQMRHLFRRDATDPQQLLAMATIHGTVAMGLAAGTATLCPGARADLITANIDPSDATDPLTQALLSDDPVCRLS